MQAVPLTHAEHADLRVITRRGAEWGDNLMSVPAFPIEFRSLQAHYPIVFQKAEDGSFQPVALLGLREGDNLFLGPQGWDAHYLPLALERMPFLIGRRNRELMLDIDLDSPRVSRSEGEPLYTPQGTPTPYLDRVNSMLRAIHEGFQQMPAFVDALLTNGLLESFVLDVELANGAQHRLAGFYTINEESLNALPDAALLALHRSGHLTMIHQALSSLSHFRDLIERENRRLPAPAAAVADLLAAALG